MIGLRITREMFEILRLHLQGLSAYKIARRLNMDPPTVYASLKAAKQNFAEADRMITQLKASGWPIKLPEIEQHIRGRAQKRKTARMPNATQNEEIPLKLG